MLMYEGFYFSFCNHFFGNAVIQNQTVISGNLGLSEMLIVVYM